MSVSLTRRGSGDPIVLVHGIGSRWQVYEPILDALAADHEVIAIDLPGFGASPLTPDVDPGPYGYADWLEGWLADQGIERPHLVGNSMGGGIALELARRGVVASATAFSPIGFWRRPGLAWTRLLLRGMRGLTGSARGALPTLTRSPVTRAALVATVYGKPWRISADTAFADATGIADAPAFWRTLSRFSEFWFDESDDMGGLRDVPVTVAWGTRDVLLTYASQSARAREVLPFVEHVSVKGGGHMPFADDPAACVALIRGTIARSDQA